MLGLGAGMRLLHRVDHRGKRYDWFSLASVLVLATTDIALLSLVKGLASENASLSSQSSVAPCA